MMKHPGRDIPGFEDRYQINQYGEVTSLHREVEDNFRGKSRIRSYPQKEIKWVKTQKGYAKVMLWKHNKMATRMVHRLVAITYIPNPENKREVNHKDGNPLNNSVENLEWVTRSENSQHSVNILGKNRGELQWASKLTDDLVKNILDLLDIGVSQKDIANKYNINPSTVSLLSRGMSWKHLTRKEGVNESTH